MLGTLSPETPWYLVLRRYDESGGAPGVEIDLLALNCVNSVHRFLTSSGHL